MRRFIGHRGFTLVELAIVLVIIGIILGAVLKGQDLIQGARTKKFITDAGKKWEISAWTHYDRKGKFPGVGAASATGLIGSGTSPNVYADYSTAHLQNPPTNPVTLGSFVFYTFLGNDGTKNVLVICKDSTCGTAFTADELGFMQTFDNTIDGTSNGGAGQVRGATAATGVPATWLASGITLDAADWNTSDKALVYYFDRK